MAVPGSTLKCLTGQTVCMTGFSILQGKEKQGFNIHVIGPTTAARLGTSLPRLTVARPANPVHSLACDLELPELIGNAARVPS